MKYALQMTVLSFLDFVCFPKEFIKFVNICDIIVCLEFYVCTYYFTMQMKRLREMACKLCFFREEEAKAGLFPLTKSATCDESTLEVCLTFHFIARKAFEVLHLNDFLGVVVVAS